MTKRHRCPGCNFNKSYKIRRGKVKCERCKYEWIPKRLSLKLKASQWRKILSGWSDTIPMSIKEIESLKPELGEDYLEKEKQSDFTLSKEIIVAIENQKPGPAALDFTGVILHTLRCNKIHS